MKTSKLILSTAVAVSAVLGIGAAAAADLSMKARPYAAVAPAFSWTGCYVGVQGGGGWGNTRFSDPEVQLFAPVGGSLDVGTSGGLVGGQIGCNYQLASPLVIGAEVAGAWTNIKGSNNVSFTTPTNIVAGTANSKTDWLASFTGRAGFDWNRVLFYGKAGAAFAGDKYGMNGQSTCIGLCLGPNPASLLYSGKETRVGWTAGAGLEWAFMDHWSAKVEYDYYDFGTDKVTFYNSAGTSLLPFAGIPANVSQRIQTVVGAINYRF
jgi:outer membrane immunogenic protein